MHPIGITTPLLTITERLTVCTARQNLIHIHTHTIEFILKTPLMHLKNIYIYKKKKKSFQIVEI